MENDRVDPDGQPANSGEEHGEENGPAGNDADANAGEGRDGGGGEGEDNDQANGDDMAGEADDDMAGEADDDDMDRLSHLPDYVLPRVDKLKDLNEKRDEIMTTYLEERAALEKKFHDLLSPIYEERAAVVAGQKDQELSSSDLAEGTETDNGDRVKGIPQFWVCCMTNMDTIGELVTEEDVDCLASLQNITCIDDEDGKGFTLRFFFAPNDYFHDTVLSKRYEVPNLLTSDEPILKNVTGCKIQWKQDRALTHRTVRKKQRGKGKHAGQVRTVTKTEQRESFFHWFDPPEMPSMEDMDEEEAERVEEAFDADYEVAQAFRSNVVQKAVLWFTGEAADEEMLAAMENLGIDESNREAEG